MADRLRVVQGIGGAMLIANSTAIITDAFPADQRGLALGINQVAGDRRLVHRPGDRRAAGRVELAGGLLGQRPGRRARAPSGLPVAARDRRTRRKAAIDWWGNLTFALGLIAAAGRHHLRHPALRRPHHGLDQPVVLAGLHRRLAAAGRVRADRDRGSPTRCST